MWVFLNDAMLSIVEDWDNPRRLLVRARLRGDIERVFPGAIVQVTETADYRFRSFIDRDQVSMALCGIVGRIDYTNFKSSVMEPRRHDAYMGVWSILHREQQLEVMEEARVGVKPARRPAAKRARAKKAKA